MESGGWQDEIGVWWLFLDDLFFLFVQRVWIFLPCTAPSSDCFPSSIKPRVFSDYFHSSDQENIHSKKTRNLPLLFTLIIPWFKHRHKIGICWSHSLKRCRFSSRMMLEFTGNWIINFKLLFSKIHYIDCSACETACNGMHGEFWTVAGVYHIHFLNMLNTTIQVIASRTLF